MISLSYIEILIAVLNDNLYCTVLQENIIQLLGRYYASKGRFPVEFQEKEVMKNTNQST